MKDMQRKLLHKTIAGQQYLLINVIMLCPTILFDEICKPYEPTFSTVCVTSQLLKTRYVSQLHTNSLASQYDMSQRVNNADFEWSIKVIKVPYCRY